MLTRLWITCLLLTSVLSPGIVFALELSGDTSGAHDPSTIVKDAGGTYWVFATADNLHLRSSVDLEQAVSSGRIRLAKGDPKEVAGVFDLFDKFVPARNYKIPPLED